MRIAYIQSGQGWPHNNIDAAVKRALGQLGHPTGFYHPKEFPERLREFTPGSWDLVLMLDGRELPAEAVNHFRAVGIRTALWLVEDPYEIDVEIGYSPLFDVVFTIEEGCLDVHRQAGAKEVYHLPLGMNEEIFRPITPDSDHSADITLVGHGFENRRRFLDEASTGLKGWQVRLVGYWWEQLEHRDMYAPLHRPEIIPPPEAARYYNSAKINLNVHRSPDDPTLKLNQLRCPGWSPNNRLFEIAGTGGFILSDFRRGLPNIFTPDQEIVTFEGPEEFLDKVRFYLPRESLREEIGQRARELVLSGHTYRHRLERLLALTWTSAFFSHISGYGDNATGHLRPAIRVGSHAKGPFR